MYSITNKVLNTSPIAIWCAYSAPNPGGGWDIWKVRLLRPGFKTSELDIDYISPVTDDYTINGRSGWWKLAQSGSFFICRNMTGSDTDMFLSSWKGSKFYHYDEWASGQYNEFYHKWFGWDKTDSLEEIDNQKKEWDLLKDWASALD